jgi:hypothetical protein
MKSRLNSGNAATQFKIFVYTFPSVDVIAPGRPRGRNSSPGRVKNFFLTSSRPALGPTQPPIQWVLGALSPGIKQKWREADHSPPASVEVKEM